MNKFKDIFGIGNQIVLDFYAKAVGDTALAALLTVKPEMLTELVKDDAMKLVEEIKFILDNKALDDSTCYEQISAIVDAFYEAGLPTDRRDYYP
ncbi:MAG: hypothetical protein HDT19_05310 [Oscillibacter sp.]|nr:hypothetical protein [Oscillibacter sp.]